MRISGAAQFYIECFYLVLREANALCTLAHVAYHCASGDSSVVQDILFASEEGKLTEAWRQSKRIVFLQSYRGA